MPLTELLPVVRSLPHSDKLRLLQFLAAELAREGGLTEAVPGVNAGGEYPVWSPYDAFEAARTLDRSLGTKGPS